MMNYILSPTLEHSFKGTTWNNHKYIEIKTKNGKKRYIYPSVKDVKNMLKKYDNRESEFSKGETRAEETKNYINALNSKIPGYKGATYVEVKNRQQQFIDSNRFNENAASERGRARRAAEANVLSKYMLDVERQKKADANSNKSQEYQKLVDSFDTAVEKYLKNDEIVLNSYTKRTKVKVR